ncbi:uncharacterized protein LOC133916915 [Phragmites australis]|uniref:uncharacterized protein LOC133916915 n=1 Tax=Phragmites australis TaxID=29695 RepID=UPI002D77D9C9|nr:uncharacterized protein LOC133916915 [Phragmites australis]XP_062216789.1 uncharacterized protein LOC133916915 [Phragmites australis]XP_062216790.1 uncharacterized protein LOC133916915 [Phragmites australis]
MEEDEQPQPPPEGEKEKEESEPPRCGRHPSQLLTGICSFCLMERLSSVRDHPEAEIVEVGAAEPVEGSGADPGKLRKTLMLLFQLDDSSGGSGIAHPSEGKDPQVAEFRVDSGGGGGGGGHRGGKWKGGSWFRSILPRKGMRWRRNVGSSKEPSVPPREAAADPSGCNGSCGDVQVERKSFRRSYEWMVCREPSRGSPEPLRHSWDGSMVGRAFACSFACLEEPPDATRRTRRSYAEEAVGENRVGVAESRSGGHSVDVGSEGRRFRGRSCGETGMEMTVSGVGRRRSNRWSRVWDRSITSPLKEFVRKGEHVLERSLSESRKEIRRGKNAEAADINGEIQPGGSNEHGSGRASQGAIRSSQAASKGDAQNFRTDWLKNKECKIGRSRSLHYTSPGNLENGMLRFYLTPMRSTRTANRGRRRNSRMFATGLFGFI